MNMYFATYEAEERRATLLRTVEEKQELEALQVAQPQRFVRVPTILEQLLTTLQHVLRRSKRSYSHVNRSTTA